MGTIGLEEARDAKERARKLFTNKAEVVGVGITRVGAGYGIKVNLSTSPDPAVELPNVIDGVPIRVEVVGPIRKQ